MDKLEVTSMSSRGQVVIPLNVREQMKLNEGEKFIVLWEGDTLLLKKLSVPAFKDFDRLIQKTREFSEKQGITPNNLRMAIKKVRK